MYDQGTLYEYSVPSSPNASVAASNAAFPYLAVCQPLFFHSNTSRNCLVQKQESSPVCTSPLSFAPPSTFHFPLLCKSSSKKVGVMKVGRKK